MAKISTAIKLLGNPGLFLERLCMNHVFDGLPDSIYLKLFYRSIFGKSLNLKAPQTYNEKIQWLKLHDRNPEYTQWVDKKVAKGKAGAVLGDEHIVPLLGSWENPEEIPFDDLPEKFVLKCNHDQGSTRIVDKAKGYDRDDMVRFFQGRLKKNPFERTREWPYKNVKPCVIAEPFLAENIIDYKFFCFNGEPRMINIGLKNAETHQTYVTFLSMDWQFMPFQRSDYPRVDVLPPRPAQLDEMIQMARRLASGRRFVRIDFFLVEGTIFFSEFTLYPTSGLIKFDPASADLELGKLLQL